MFETSGIGVAWNYTIGPAVVYRDLTTLNIINTSTQPLVVMAHTLGIEELMRIDMTRARGFVFEEGSRADPTVVFFSNQHRAAVLGATDVMAHVKDGDTVIIDGVEGKVFVNPDGETLAHYETLRREGPPPEPPSATDQLLKDALDIQNFNPDAMAKELFDAPGIAKAMDTFLKMHGTQEISGQDEKNIMALMEGSDKADSVREKLAKYRDLAKQVADQEAGKSAEGDAAGRGRGRKSRKR